MNQTFTLQTDERIDDNLAARVREHFQNKPYINGEPANINNIYIGKSSVQVTYNHAHEELNKTYDLTDFITQE
jgi:hypothetical protein